MKILFPRLSFPALHLLKYDISFMNKFKGVNDLHNYNCNKIVIVIITYKITFQ